MTPPNIPPGRLIGPGGQVLGQAPVVAHILTFPPGTELDGIQMAITYWMKTTGVPAIVVADGMTVAGQLLADGTIELLPVDEVLSARVQTALLERGEVADQIRQHQAATEANGNGATGG